MALDDPNDLTSSKFHTSNQCLSPVNRIPTSLPIVPQRPNSGNEPFVSLQKAPPDLESFSLDSFGQTNPLDLCFGRKALNTGLNLMISEKCC